jgi:uncharacterized protein (DUF736 family)
MKMSDKNLGKLWKNDKKTLEKHPDYRGHVWINSEKFDLGGWIRDGENGKYISLSARLHDPSYDKPRDGVNRTIDKGVGSAHDLNDAIPF